MGRRWREPAGVDTKYFSVAKNYGALDDVCARLDGWSQRCIAAGAFPADILKRAAG